MSVAGIISNLFSGSPQTVPSVQSKGQQFRQEFDQLGKDLQSGNVSAAQQDFATLQQLAPQRGISSSAQGSSAISAAVNQLSQALQSGNVAGAQQDFSAIEQAFQDQTAKGHHHHHHNGGASGTQSSQASQLFSQLGQDLQSGNLAAAQRAYSALQMGFPKQGTSGSSGSTTSAQPISAGISFSA
jgi:outer membrane protein assembly factor BamD (BamD/ComL family)